MCNKAPVDGKSQAADWTNSFLGGDRETEFKFIYQAADFACFKD